MHQLQLENDQLVQKTITAQKEAEDWKVSHNELTRQERASNDSRTELQKQLSTQSAQIADLQRDLNEGEVSRTDLESKITTLQEDSKRAESDNQRELEALQQALRLSNSDRERSPNPHNASKTLRRSPSPQTHETKPSSEVDPMDRSGRSASTVSEPSESEGEVTLGNPRLRRRADRRTASSFTSTILEPYSQEERFGSSHHQSSGLQVSFAKLNEQFPPLSPIQKSEINEDAVSLSADNLEGSGRIADSYDQLKGFTSVRAPQLLNEGPVRTQTYSANSGFRLSRQSPGPFSTSSGDELGTPTGRINTVNPQQLWRGEIPNDNQDLANLSTLTHAQVIKTYGKKGRSLGNKALTQQSENFRERPSVFEEGLTSPGPARKRVISRSTTKGVVDQYSPPKTRSSLRVSGGSSGSQKEKSSGSHVEDQDHQQHSVAWPPDDQGTNNGIRRKARRTNLGK